MQLALGRKGDYSVRAVLEVTRHYGERRVKAREIAEAMDIPERYAPQILADLVRRGLLSAVAGPDGGYALVRPPDEVSLLEVVEAAEGPLRGEQCILRGGCCEWEDICPLHVPWRRAQDALIEQLQATTFAELSGLDRAIVAGELKTAGGPGHRARPRTRATRKPDP